MLRSKFFKRISLLMLGLTAVLFAVAAWGRSNPVEIRPQVDIPTYTSDVDRVMAAYESMVNRLLDQQQVQLISVAQENQDLSKQVAILDHKLDMVLKKLTRMEKAMGLVPEEPEAPIQPDQESATPIAP